MNPVDESGRKPIDPARRIERVLAACRGEPALRVVRSGKALGMEVVVLIREEDAEAAWPDEADYASYVPDDGGEPWPTPERAISAALDAGCDAIHPGWGPLCRSSIAAELAIRSGLAWLGSSPQSLELVADRSEQRRIAEQLQVPVVPGSDPLSEILQVRTWLAFAGTPALLKPVDTIGLPGRSIRIDNADRDAARVIEALAEGPALLERLVVGAREIEVPVLGGSDGRVATLGDRETTVRHGLDRLLVEAPAPGLSSSTREALHRDAARVAQAMQWRGNGAVRFLVTPDGRPYFLGLKPGLSPWHAATEVSLGVDLVDAELTLASGADLFWSPAELSPEGHVMALRVPAAADGVLTRPEIADDLRFHPAASPGDLIAAGKVPGTFVVRAPTRQACIVRARALLDHWPLPEIAPLAEPLRGLLAEPGFWKGPLDRDRVALLLGDAGIDAGAPGRPPPL